MAATFGQFPAIFRFSAALVLSSPLFLADVFACDVEFAWSAGLASVSDG